MAWSDSLPVGLRQIIGDTSPSPTFTDDQLAVAICTAGLIVATEHPFKAQYSFDLQAPQILPDPTLLPTLDLDAMALFILRAACIIQTANFTNALTSGIEVRDGSSAVKTTGSLSGYADILRLGPCLSYKELVKLLIMRKSMNQGRAVMGPTSRGESLWGNQSILGNFSARGFFDYFCRY